MISCNNSVLPEVPFGTNCNSDTCIAVQDGDISQLQFVLTEVSGNLISNGNFSSGSSGWTTSGAFWTIGTNATWTNSGSSGSISRTTDTVLEAGYYRVKFDIQAVQGGTSATFEAKLGGVSLGSIANAEMEAQTLNFYKYLTPASSIIEIFVGYSNPIVIDKIELYRMSELQYKIMDCETEEVFYEDETNANVAYFSTGNIGESGEVLQEGSFEPTAYGLITIDWEAIGLDEDCYCVCVKDKGDIDFNRIKNGDFHSTEFWDITNFDSSGWSIGSGVATHSILGAAGDDILAQTLAEVLERDSCYSLTFTATPSGSSTLIIYGEQSPLPDVEIYSSGAFASAINPTITFGGASITKLKFIGTGYFTIDNITLRGVESCFDCEYQSMCISYKNSHDSTFHGLSNMLLKGTQDNDGLGFNFSDFDFTNSVRVFGNLRNSTYDFPEEEYYKDSVGVNRIVYTGFQKYKQLQIRQVSEALHDIIALISVHGTFSITIDGEERQFIKRQGSISPQWRKTSGDAPVIIEVAEKTQNIFNG